jgi:glyoxylase-like metal-dependent hydrolase (beta-lactamase superfamily II)
MRLGAPHHFKVNKMKIKRFEFNMFPVNCYVVWDETYEAVVIDPGCYYEEEKQALKTFILSNKLTVKHLLNTHLHLDHIFGNPFMLKEFGLKAEACQIDEFWLENAAKQSRMFGFELKEEPVPLGKYLHDGDIISFGNTQLEAIHVPGHSPGSLVFYSKGDNCMFSGDVLFQGSIGRADLAGGNFDDLREHICSRLFVLPNETIVYPGHGAPTTIGIEKVENPFFR